MNAILKDTLRDLERRGHRVEKGKGGHFKVFHSNGTSLVVLPHTPGRGRWERNMLALLKRQGFLA